MFTLFDAENPHDENLHDDNPYDENAHVDNPNDYDPHEENPHDKYHHDISQMESIELTSLLSIESVRSTATIKQCAYYASLVDSHVCIYGHNAIVFLQADAQG